MLYCLLQGHIFNLLPPPPAILVLPPDIQTSEMFTSLLLQPCRLNFASSLVDLNPLVLFLRQQKPKVNNMELGFTVLVSKLPQTGT